MSVALSTLWGIFLFVIYNACDLTLGSTMETNNFKHDFVILADRGIDCCFRALLEYPGASWSIWECSGCSHMSARCPPRCSPDVSQIFVFKKISVCRFRAGVISITQFMVSPGGVGRMCPSVFVLKYWLGHLIDIHNDFLLPYCVDWLLSQDVGT